LLLHIILVGVGVLTARVLGSFYKAVYLGDEGKRVVDFASVLVMKLAS
jgi:hypothetical protein